MRKEIIYKIILVLILILPLFIFAQRAEDVERKAEEAARGIAKILGWLASAIGAAVLAFGVYQVATCSGDPIGLSKGTHNIIWGAIGIILGAALVSLDTILGFFGANL